MLRSAPLLAACALALAVPAGAEIRFSGDARMGLVPDHESREGERRTEVATGGRLQIDIERETDTGLRFLLTLELDDGRFPRRGPRD